MNRFVGSPEESSSHEKHKKHKMAALTSCAFCAFLSREDATSRSSKWFHFMARNYQRCCDEHQVFYYKLSIHR